MMLMCACIWVLQNYAEDLHITQKPVEWHIQYQKASTYVSH